MQDEMTAVGREQATRMCASRWEGVLNVRAMALADQFERANEEFIAAVERLSGNQWGAMCASEGWSVAVATHRVAATHTALAGLVRAIVAGGALPPYFAGTSEELHRAKAALVHGLDDPQLDCTAAIPAFGGRVLSPQQVIERILIGHIGGHLASIQAAQGASAAT